MIGQFLAPFQWRILAELWFKKSVFASDCRASASGGADLMRTIRLAYMAAHQALFGRRATTALAEGFLLVTAEQIDDLSNEIELTSTDYRQEAGPAFSRDGKLSKVWNHFLLKYQDLPTKIVSGRVVQRNPAYFKSDLMLGVWQDVKSDAWEDTGKFKELYMNICANMDCRRLDETGVNEIESDLQAA